MVIVLAPAAFAQQSVADPALIIQSPLKGVQTVWPFYKPTKYLYIKEYNIHVLGTETVSDWMMGESYSMISHVVAALKSPEYRNKFSGHQAFLITDADPDLSIVGSVKGHRNTGSRGKSLFNEALVCTTAVDTIRPNGPPVYRAWEVPIHEFGHSVEHTLQLESQSDAIYSKNVPNYNPKIAREYFAWATEKWFASRINSKGREAMPKWEIEYLSSIFSQDDPWVPSQKPRPQNPATTVDSQFKLGEPPTEKPNNLPKPPNLVFFWLMICDRIAWDYLAIYPLQSHLRSRDFPEPSMDFIDKFIYNFV